MNIKVIVQEFSICQLTDIGRIPPAVYQDDFFFIGKTDEELSLVCVSTHVPDDAVKRDDGWRAFRIQGVLDFSMTGVLSKLSGLLAGAGIPIFALSTYNTDYILVKKESLNKALSALSAAGYDII
jgi:hypothetical protein